MIKFFSFFLALCLPAVSFSIFAPIEDFEGRALEQSQGHAVWKFCSGKMQIDSQIDEDENIVILIESLDKNTQVEFINIDTSNSILKVLMKVAEKTDFCASWTNHQEVTIGVNPIRVTEISLKGEKIYNSGKFTILKKKFSQRQRSLKDCEGEKIE